MSYESPAYAASTAHLGDLRRERSARHRAVAESRLSPAARALAAVRRRRAAREAAMPLVLSPSRCAPHH